MSLQIIKSIEKIKIVVVLNNSERRDKELASNFNLSCMDSTNYL